MYNKFMEKPKSDSKNSSKKKIYKSPKLIKYGSLKELTKFGGSMSSDFFGMQS